MSKRQSTKVDKVCEYCNTPFSVTQCVERRTKPKFCKYSCFASSRRGKTTHTQTIEEILEDRVDKSTGCWVWTGSKSVVIQGVHGQRGGYGELRYNQKLYHVHRLSWSIHNKQEIPDDKEVCHHCDNPPCFNPEHLFLGTRKENMQDMTSKGRAGAKYGSNHKSAKLTEEQVIELRKLRSEGVSTVELAKRYGVAGPTVVNIAKRRSWVHI